MKRSICGVVTLIFALCFTLSTVAYADSSRASEQIRSYNIDITKMGGGQLGINFSVVGTGEMQELGANSIIIYEKSENTWYKVAYYDQEDEGMTETDTFIYENEIIFQGTPGKQYRILVSIFAKDPSGSDSRSESFTVTA